MIKIFTPLLIIFFTSLLLFSSCYKEPEILKIKTVKIIGVENDSINLLVNTLLENLNPFQIKVSNILFDYYYNDEKIGKGYVDTVLVLSKKSVSEIETNNILYLSKLSFFFEKIALLDSFPVKVYVKANFSTLKIPVKATFVKYIKTDELINNFFSSKNISENLRIHNITVKKSGVEKTNLDIVLEFQNFIPANFEIKKMNMNVFDNDNSKNLLGKTSSDILIHVRKDSIVYIPLSVEINNFTSAFSMISKFIRQDRSFFLSGIIFIDIEKQKFELPVQMMFEVPLP